MIAGMRDLTVVLFFTGQVGETIRLDKVLMVGDATFTKIGLPLVANSYVVAVIEEQVIARLCARDVTRVTTDTGQQNNSLQETSSQRCARTHAC
jgi:ribosomal protein L21